MDVNGRNNQMVQNSTNLIKSEIIHENDKSQISYNESEFQKS